MVDNGSGGDNGRTNGEISKGMAKLVNGSLSAGPFPVGAHSVFIFSGLKLVDQPYFWGLFTPRIHISLSSPKQRNLRNRDAVLINFSQLFIDTDC
ncbi:hypothetical protein Nepgr_025709 [Nepenthes gracilis]|uniref:Uncharacterized protein n=1 Tax=Nepenthes gracilis TaxID=150966 RepID=A0AAD3Y1T3_NEPGR|nr:hypothetical protein Nepgr_025709 [Nepenthes gracilis]